MKFKNVTIIEQPIMEEIEIKEANLFCDPVQSLDDLLIWEDVFAQQGRDYAIAEFVMRGEHGKAVHYGIFCNDASKIASAMGEYDLVDEDNFEFN